MTESARPNKEETMAEHNAVVGVYNSHTDAEAAVKELQKPGFDMMSLPCPIIGPGHETLGLWHLGCLAHA